MCCCFGKDIKSACKYMALADMITGFMMVVYLGNRLSDLYNEDLLHAKGHKPISEAKLENDRIVAWLLLVFSYVQCVMGAVLYLAVLKHDIPLCQTYIWTSFLILIFTIPLLLRFEQIGLVGEFCNAVQQGRIQTDRESDTSGESHGDEPVEELQVSIDAEAQTILNNLRIQMAANSQRNTAYYLNSEYVNERARNQHSTVLNIGALPGYDLPPEYEVAISVSPQKF